MIDFRPRSVGPGLVLLAVILYPFAIYFLIDDVTLPWLGIILITLFGLRLLPLLRKRWWLLWALLLLGAAFVVLLEWTGDSVILKIYPTIISLALLVAFGITLVKPPSMVERFAKQMGTTINEHVAVYTRRVTIIWCLFFALNAAVSAGIGIAGSFQAWTIYNGFIAYLLVGILLGGEYLYRQRYIHRDEILDKASTADCPKFRQTDA